MAYNNENNNINNVVPHYLATPLETEKLLVVFVLNAQSASVSSSVLIALVESMIAGSYELFIRYHSQLLQSRYLNLMVWTTFILLERERLECLRRYQAQAALNQNVTSKSTYSTAVLHTYNNLTAAHYEADNKREICSDNMRPNFSTQVLGVV